MRSLPSLRPAVLAAALAAAALVAASPAHAIVVNLEAPQLRSDTLWISVRLGELFNPRIEESLSRGMPATLQIHGELWQRRAGWFDRLESDVDAELRVRWEVWNRTYRVERRGAPAVRYRTLDSLSAALGRPLLLPVGRVRPGTGNRVRYVAVTATLQPLSVEDVAEVESWLSGEVESKRGSGFGLVTQVPRALFDAVRNVAGFGDDRGRSLSPDFRLSER